jgi:hypothetical protein
MLLRYRRLILPELAALLLLSFIAINTTAAQGEPASIAIQAVQVTSCENDVVEGFIQLVVRDSAGSIVDVSGMSDFIITFSASGVVNTFTFPSSTVTGVDFGVSLPGVGTGSIDVTATLSADSSVGSPVLRINCGTLAYEILGSESGGSADGRLNPNAGDLLNVLYAGVDDSGNPVIDVYQVDGTTGIFVGEFDYELFELYLDAAPDTNTELGTVDQATLYALTTGEFQINIGPDVEGKYGIVIFSGLPPSSTRRGILELQ